MYYVLELIKLRVNLQILQSTIRVFERPIQKKILFIQTNSFIIFTLPRLWASGLARRVDTPLNSSQSNTMLEQPQKKGEPTFTLFSPNDTVFFK
jgi:hypothetical protein